MSMQRRDTIERKRKELLSAVHRLAQRAIFGTASLTRRCCGNKGCRCHHGGPKHGPHVYVSYRDRAAGKTAGYYVPHALQEQILDGLAAWQELQQRLRELAELNKGRALQQAQRSGS